VRAVVLSAVVLAVAAALEVAAAIASRSASVLADGLHNSGDVLTTLVLLASFAIARRPATRRYPSGFGRIEDVATLVIVLVIVVTALLAFAESVRKFFVVETYGNIAFGLLAAAAGVAGNLAVSEYKIRVGRGLGSPALEAAPSASSSTGCWTPSIRIWSTRFPRPHGASRACSQCMTCGRAGWAASSGR